MQPPNSVFKTKAQYSQNERRHKGFEQLGCMEGRGPGVARGGEKWSEEVRWWPLSLTPTCEFAPSSSLL